MWKVNIIESEAGWGQKVIKTIKFNSLKKAQKFVKEYNLENNKKQHLVFTGLLQILLRFKFI